MLVEIMASSGMLLKKDGDILGARSKNTDPNLRGLFVFFFCLFAFSSGFCCYIIMSL